MLTKETGKGAPGGHSWSTGRPSNMRKMEWATWVRRDTQNSACPCCRFFEGDTQALDSSGSVEGKPPGRGLEPKCLPSIVYYFRVSFEAWCSGFVSCTYVSVTFV